MRWSMHVLVDDLTFTKDVHAMMLDIVRKRDRSAYSVQLGQTRRKGTGCVYEIRIAADLSDDDVDKLADELLTIKEVWSVW